MSNIVIYKAIFGGYDNPPEPISFKVKDNVKFILLSDKKIDIAGWETRLVKHDDAVLSNRHCKMFPWKYFESDISIYLDGHIEFGVSFMELVDDLSISKAKFAVMKHRYRGDINHELVRCIDNDKVNRDHVVSVLGSGLLLNLPAVECGMIFRNHGSSQVRDHASRWWWYFNNVCPRDQLSVHTAARDASLEISILNFDFSKLDFFRLVGHKNRKLNIIRTRLKLAARVLLKGTLLRA